MKYYTLATLLALFLTSCATQKIKNITYLPQELQVENTNPKMDIYIPKEKPTELMPVIIFIHGGNWNHGTKNTYGFYGRDLAKRNIVAVIPTYTLSPKVTYDTQAEQVAAAIQWTKDNIKDYGGDPNQIFMNGHSAGGELSALSVMNPKYNVDQSEISGIILNDAAGLDMYWQNTANPPKVGGFYNYGSTFTMEPENWKDASPIYFISEENPPFLMFSGERSIKAIVKTNDDFVQKLREVQPGINYIKLNKSHFPMMLQFIFGGAKQYRTMEQFIAKQR